MRSCMLQCPLHNCRTTSLLETLHACIQDVYATFAIASDDALLQDVSGPRFKLLASISLLHLAFAGSG